MCNLATSAVKEEGSGEGKSIMSRTQKTKGAREGRESHSVPASAWSFFTNNLGNGLLDRRWSGRDIISKVPIGGRGAGLASHTRSLCFET